jgi:transcriptional regulator with XRE-family HTH domain
MAALIDQSREAETREQTLHRFVRERRLRLAPELCFLGESPRLPIRIGKPVTQEEVAEHLEISRGWYSRFEAGAAAGFSIALLGRLCDLLLLSATERADLMQLATPALAPIISRDSDALYEAIRDVRKSVKRLWNATSEGEILQRAGEEARRMLPHPELIWVQRDFRDEAQFPHPEWKAAARFAEAKADTVSRLTPDQMARLVAVWERIPVGSILPFEAYPRDIVRLTNLTLREYGFVLESLPLMAAHIQGCGLSGGLISWSTQPQDVTRLERAVLSALADFASLALR